jgi:putative ABC transport system permease protein
MLVARSSVESKISDVKANTGTSITINPAGVQGFAGGGNPLTSAQVASIQSTAHVVSTTATLSDQMGTSDTNLTASLTLGSFGARQQRFESTSSGSTSATSTDSAASLDAASTRPAPTPRISVTGTTNPDSYATNGGSLTISSGKTFDGTSTDLVALVGSSLATKNSLTTGSTFTAYGKTVTVVGIFTTGNTFQDSGMIMPIAAVQTLTSQAGDASSVVAKVDSSENVDSTIASIKSTLGSSTVDITSEAQQAASSVSSLSAISGLALAGVIGATIAGAVIVLLAMVMIVRERRREIGVIKAIGGTTSKVVAQFVTEALTLTVIGAIIGLSLGVVASGPMTNSLVSSQTTSTTTASVQQGGGAGPAFRRGISQLNSNLTKVQGSLTPQVFIASVGITLLIAIIGSAVPAWFISRIRPAEVLRTE